MAASWKRDFASGLIILFPLLVTLFIVYWIYGRLAEIPIPGNELYEPLRVLLTLAVFVLLVFAAGFLMRTAFGAVIERAIDDLMNQLPGLRVVYNASKMAVETALSGTDQLQTPVKVDVWGDLRMTAFKTGKTTEAGRDLLFLPTAPNITTGFVIEVEPDRYIETTETTEEALTRLLSAGFGDTQEEHSIIEVLDDANAPGAGSGSPGGATDGPAPTGDGAGAGTPDDATGRGADGDDGSSGSTTGGAGGPSDRSSGN